MVANDQEKIKIAREYLMRGDQGRPDVLELFDESSLVVAIEAIATRQIKSLVIGICRRLPIGLDKSVPPSIPSDIAAVI